MTDERRPREFYINREDFDKAYAACDLGDWYEVDISFYPHVKTEPFRFLVREVIDEEPAKFDWFKRANELARLADDRYKELEDMRALAGKLVEAVSTLEYNFECHQWCDQCQNNKALMPQIQEALADAKKLGVE